MCDIFKVVLTDDAGQLYKADAIRHEDRIWIVSGWNEQPHGAQKSPIRIICPDQARFQWMEGQWNCYWLLGKVSKPVLYGPSPEVPDGEYVVVDHPPLLFPR